LTQSEVQHKAKLAKEAARALAATPTGVKNAALVAIAEALVEKSDVILGANFIDKERARINGASDTLLDRLTLDEDRIEEIAEGFFIVASLPDPVGEVIKGWRRPNGLEIRQVRVPIGVIGIIYEARPNVTADAAALCLKSGNACILRGGSEAINSNKAIAEIMAEAAVKAGVPENAIQLIESTDREAARELMRMNGYVDALIPRGGAGLIKAVVETATVPVIETGCGNCHTYVDASAELDMAHDIVINAKVQRPGVCNAMETLLVSEQIASEFLPTICGSLLDAGVEIRGCERTREICPEAKPATEEDYYTEYLALILAVKVVSGVEEAIAHINKYGTKHSEAIVTRDYDAARRFQQDVDAAAVYVNASTRFTDGFEFGFGAEIGISNQKLHARGPMGLQEITTYKYVIDGSGQIR
jgi:glutamate-5-semialdehyde dehydrogenase